MDNERPSAEEAFDGIAQRLHESYDEARAYARDGGVFARRFSVLAAKIEDALLHARAGRDDVHEWQDTHRSSSHATTSATPPFADDATSRP